MEEVRTSYILNTLLKQEQRNQMSFLECTEVLPSLMILFIIVIYFMELMILL